MPQAASAQHAFSHAFWSCALPSAPSPKHCTPLLLYGNGEAPAVQSAGGAGAGGVGAELDETPERQQRKASWLRPANWPRLFAKLAMGKLGAVLGTTLLMKPLCSAACAPEMADSWDAVPGLAPVWERLCG